MQQGFPVQNVLVNGATLHLLHISTITSESLSRMFSLFSKFSLTVRDTKPYSVCCLGSFAGV